MVISTLAAIIFAAIGAASTAASVAANSTTSAVTSQLDREQETRENELDRQHESAENALDRAQEKDLKINEKQYLVEDLRKAGLNPALAMGGISTGTATTSAQPTAGSSGIKNTSISSNSSQVIAQAAAVVSSRHLNELKREIFKISNSNAREVINKLNTSRVN